MQMKQKAIILAEDSSSSNWLGTARSLHKKVPIIRLTSKNWYNSKTCTSIISPDVAEKPIIRIFFLWIILFSVILYLYGLKAFTVGEQKCGYW